MALSIWTGGPLRVVEHKGEEGAMVDDPAVSPNGHQLENDRSLLHRCQQGEVEAFGEIYELYVDRIYRHIYYLMRNHSEAEDLTAETFLRAWQAIGRYRWRDRPLLSWLLTIAHNLVVSRLRRNSHRGSSLEFLQDQGVVPSVQPEERYLTSLQHEQVLRAILQLKPQERTVLVLRFVEQMEYDEVAAALGKTVNAVRVVQFRALNNLRTLLLPPSTG
ncbi:MAG TPA: sigma-70 family RNA polymerase sigma factor [Dehalococcoidia bacterium]|nr:sigma-70 family RNA polymerase sigma factor [Dehalococcoidia bacterium]